MSADRDNVPALDLAKSDARIIALAAAWLAIDDEASRPGLPTLSDQERDDRVNALVGLNSPIVEKLARLPAASAEAICAKVRVALRIHPPDPEYPWARLLLSAIKVERLGE
jgi:hypothetical protein